MTSITAVLMDGAMGTSLVDLGFPAGLPPCLASLQSPARVRSVHGSYLHVGARVLQTNTFVATRGHLEAVGWGDSVTSVIHAATRLAREVVAESEAPLLPGVPPRPRPLVAGDLGPALASTDYREALEAFASADGGIDILMLETFSDPDDLHAALEACDATLPRVPLMVSFFGQPGRLDRLATLVHMLDGHANIEAVGLNCWSRADGFLTGFRALRERHSGPLLARPSMPAGGQAAWLELTTTLIHEGAAWIGGCCGTSAPDLARLAARLTDGNGKLGKWGHTSF